MPEFIPNNILGRRSREDFEEEEITTGPFWEDLCECLDNYSVYNEDTFPESSVFYPGNMDITREDDILIPIDYSLEHGYIFNEQDIELLLEIFPEDRRLNDISEMVLENAEVSYMDCCVCYDVNESCKYKLKHSVGLGCNSSMCKNCIKKWFVNKDRCPYCNVSVKIE